MRLGYCMDSGARNNKEVPVGVVRQVLGQVANTGAIREEEDMRSSAIVVEEPADGGVDVPRWKVGVVAGGGKADPAVRGGDDAAWKAIVSGDAQQS